MVKLVKMDLMQFVARRNPTNKAIQLSKRYFLMMYKQVMSYKVFLQRGAGGEGCTDLWGVQTSVFYSTWVVEEPFRRVKN